ncbi:unnamed protein product [Clonostachys chloroleuca]|uniref:Xylanolytic transcriptional activator regulatory domain-containing protein n=1 Tax=Clonostachys chloroleuca TaxID=1926264 RepID=A0AA35VKP2_9HYPO|nr:unnamed protein product [Clonostachys chloroleuca]
MPTDHVSLAHSNRCNTVFWVAYIIDRDFSTLVGAPSSIRDEDITTKLPSEIDDSMNAAAMTLQIRLSRLTATILTGVYGVDRNFDGSLLRETQSVLHKLAAVCRDLTSYLGTTLHGTNIKTSKLATRLILSYHHCVVLTTRPLVIEMEEFSPWGLLGSDGNFAISPNEILNLTEGLNMEEFLLRE